MSGKLISILLVNTSLFVLLLRLVFGSFKEIKKCFYYLWMPNIVSIIYKDFDNDFKYTYKFLFVVAIMVIITFLEFYFFYYTRGSK